MKNCNKCKSENTVIVDYGEHCIEYCPSCNCQNLLFGDE